MQEIQGCGRLFTHHLELNRACQHFLYVHVQRPNGARKMWALGHASWKCGVPSTLPDRDPPSSESLGEQKSGAVLNIQAVHMSQSKGCKQKFSLAIFSLYQASTRSKTCGKQRKRACPEFLTVSVQRHYPIMCRVCVWRLLLIFLLLLPLLV